MALGLSGLFFIFVPIKCQKCLYNPVNRTQFEDIQPIKAGIRRAKNNNNFFHTPWLLTWLDHGALPRMWYVEGSRPDGAQVGRFSLWGIAVPKGFLSVSAYFSS